MCNYRTAREGIRAAALVLGIKVSNVHFFNNNEVNGKKINAFFSSKKYEVFFNEVWLQNADWIEIIITCFHESRHAFQYEVIKNKYKGNLIIKNEVKELWEKEMNFYKSVLDNNEDDFYLMQDIEVDAIVFAHIMIIKYFDINKFITKSKKQKAKDKMK